MMQSCELSQLSPANLCHPANQFSPAASTTANDSSQPVLTRWGHNQPVAQPSRGHVQWGHNQPGSKHSSAQRKLRLTVKGPGLVRDLKGAWRFSICGMFA